MSDEIADALADIYVYILRRQAEQDRQNAAAGNLGGTPAAALDNQAGEAPTQDGR
jgi:hypothetical protein